MQRWLAGLLVVTLNFAPAPMLAQPTTPAATPAPVVCDVQPVTISDMVAPATPSSAPGVELKPVPPGEPVDATTAAEITATVRLFEACVNSGDQLRVLALFADDVFHHSSPGALADLKALAATTPTPAPAGRRAVLLGPWRLEQLPDGRVLAALLLGSEAERCLDLAHTKAAFFVPNGGRWLLEPFSESLWTGGPNLSERMIDRAGPPPAALLVGQPAPCPDEEQPVKRDRPEKQRRPRPNASPSAP